MVRGGFCRRETAGTQAKMDCGEVRQADMKARWWAPHRDRNDRKPRQTKHPLGALEVRTSEWNPPRVAATDGNHEATGVMEQASIR